MNAAALKPPQDLRCQDKFVDHHNTVSGRCSGQEAVELPRRTGAGAGSLELRQADERQPTSPGRLRLVVAAMWVDSDGMVVGNQPNGFDTVRYRACSSHALTRPWVSESRRCGEELERVKVVANW